MKSFNQLRQDYEKQVKELQRKCPHQRSKWMLSCWADGHFNDFIVKVCNFCHKTIEKKTPTEKERALLMLPKPELLEKSELKHFLTS